MPDKKALSKTPASIDLRSEQNKIICQGNWSATNMGSLESQLARLSQSIVNDVELDGSRITALDSAGALVLLRTAETLRKAGRSVKITGLQAEYAGLVSLIQAQEIDQLQPEKPPELSLLEQIGKTNVVRVQEITGYVSFVGELFSVLAGVILRPSRLRIKELLFNIQDAGFNALPIIGLLSFLIGVVIAYQSGVQLQNYGANIYVVDLISLSMTRELAPLMTAILVAGRTGSAYTAKIGTMKVREEIDAITVLGFSTMELLVLPKLLGLIIVVPMLTFYADILGIFGGLVMANSMLGVSTAAFLHRLPEALSLSSYLVGLSKSPVFAAIIATVGCYQGFMVAGSAESVGRHTTISVVQAIFLVIITDAMFSIVFSWMGI
jgi:phospholipid/cholesterol/gamma-HCH transport system permease protein